MNLHSAVIKAFKNLTHVAFEARGNHIILKGLNGSGKTSILETLDIAFRGKDAVPKNPVQIGQESSLITWNIGNGNEIQFTITVTISGDDYKVKLQQYINGQKATIASPAKFLKSLILDTALDPQSFFAKSDKDQVQALYDILPGLKDDLDKIDAAYKSEQENRSKINAGLNTLQADYDRLQYYTDVPEKELNSAELMSELTNVNEHNKGKTILVESLRNSQNEIVLIDSGISQTMSKMDYLKKEIEVMQNQLNAHQEFLTGKYKQKAETENKIEDLNSKISQFEEIPVEPIQEKISKLGETNRKIQENQQKKTLEDRLEKGKKLYSEGLQKMRKLEQDRIDVFKTAKMPIKGLSVGDGCLMFDDPKTGNPVRLKSLSTGQQWAVVIPILAAFLPAAEKGLRTMVVKNLNDLDKENQELMFAEADKAGVQLVMHQTVFESETDQCEIIIKD